MKHLTSADLATIMVPTGRYIEFRDGYVLFVEKRDGTALQNITVYKAASDGGKTTIKTTIRADNGTFSPGPDERTMKITLQDARSASGSNTTTNKELILMLR